MRKWLARLGFSFVVIAAWLAWEAYRAASDRRGDVPEWQIGLYIAGAVVAFVLGLVGLRERHRPPPGGL